MKDEQIFGLLDITSLDDLDTESGIRQWSQKIARVSEASEGQFKPAAICVYSTLIKAAKEGIGGLPIPLAAVTGNFPSGKAEIGLKVDETKRAIDAGAQEIDWVVDRGAAIESDGESVYEEVRFAREACGLASLKVILESGQIQNQDLLLKMANQALLGGANFLKTSTGKIPVGATRSAVQVFCSALKSQPKSSAGIKVSGGIRDKQTALEYISLVEKELNWDIAPATFRIGASSLAGELLSDTVWAEIWNG